MTTKRFISIELCDRLYEPSEALVSRAERLMEAMIDQITDLSIRQIKCVCAEIDKTLEAYYDLTEDIFLATNLDPTRSYFIENNERIWIDDEKALDNRAQVVADKRDAVLDGLKF